MFSTGSADDTEQELSIVKQSINHTILGLCAVLISIFCLSSAKQDLTNKLNNVESNLPDRRKIKSVGSIFTLASLSYFFKLSLYNISQPHEKAIDCWIDKTSAFALILSIVAAAINLTNLFADYNVEQQETI
ncbi:MAG TPA: hypothetical protein DCP97_00645 [Ruminococcaceae bacterium]|nr:hypothetical protein [Oscillospiraceae bacterium]